MGNPCSEQRGSHEEEWLHPESVEELAGSVGGAFYTSLESSWVPFGMFARMQLLGRFVLPLSVLGVLLGSVVFWALFHQQAGMLERELRVRAQLVAGEVERYATHYGSVAETVQHVYTGAGSNLDVRRLDLVELARGDVVVTAGDTAIQLPVFAGHTEWADGNLMSFSVPVSLPAALARGVGGRDFSVVATLDASALAAYYREQLRVLAGISLVGAAALICGVLFLFRGLVLNPVGRIQVAVQQARVSGRWRMPVMRSDELGDLSRLLETNVRQLADQQQFMRSMFESLAGVAYRADARSGEILLSSGGLENLFGPSALHTDLFGSDTSEAYQRFLSAVAEGELWSLEYAVDESRTQWFAHRGRAVYGRDGKPLFYDGLLLDVTEHKHREDQIALMSEAIRGSSNEVYIIASPSLRMSFANRAALDNLGYDEQELRQLVVQDIAPLMRNDDVVAALADQMQTSNEIRYRYSHVRKDGSEYPFEFTAIGVQRGEQQWLIVLGSDISQRQEQEEAIRQSEERLSLALEGSHYGIFDYAGKGTPMYLSDSVRDWLGLGAQEQIHFSSVLRALHPEDLLALQQTLAARQGTETDFSVEVRLRADEADVQWLHLRGHADFDEDGALHRISGFASDVSRRKIAEDLAFETVGRLEAVLEHVAEGIVTLTDDGCVSTANTAFIDMFATTADQVTGMPFSRWFDEAMDLQALADGKPREYRGVRQGGWKIPCEIAVREMAEGHEDRYTVVVRDNSERHRAETELRSAMEAAQAATRAKGEFLATMSHEIRTPMNGVLGMTQLLLDMDLNPAQQETAQVIYSSGEALLAIINDILDFSKIEAGKLEFEEAPFDLESAIREVMELLSNSATSKQLDLYVDYPANLPVAFVGDVGRVRQVLVNLVGNAIKFTDRGHVIVSVESLDDGELTVRVRDTGPGLARDVQPKLFDSFTQADASTTRKFGGTGLGLAICKQLVVLMGGEIGVNSAPGEGAEFWFTLRLPAAQHTPGSSTDERALRGARVLIVDDNPIGREILRRMMTSLGAICASVDSGSRCLEFLRDQAFDLVLLDYHMPGMDGLQVLNAIRADATLASTRVLMLTSSDVPRTAGVVGAVKPVMRNTVARLSASLLAGDDGQAEEPSGSQDGEEAVLRRLRVLLAEDNAVNQKVAVRMLEKLGCTVDVAGNGQEAIQMWQQFPYALIFMDCQMPELDGLEATRRIRRMRGGEDVPIVAMTANAMQRDREACLEAGMSDYASKPVKLDVLSDLLDRYASPGG